MKVCREYLILIFLEGKFCLNVESGTLLACLGSQVLIPTFMSQRWKEGTLVILKFGDWIYCTSFNRPLNCHDHQVNCGLDTINTIC